MEKSLVNLVKAQHAIGKHITSMNTYQRQELVRVLKDKKTSYKTLSKLTDAELHEKWIVLCEYPNPYKKE